MKKKKATICSSVCSICNTTPEPCSYLPGTWTCKCFGLDPNESKDFWKKAKFDHERHIGCTK